jgi:outer membrane receptor protein involved in Fe transport
MVQAVLNIPLIEDELAIRGVAYKFDNSGYTENVVVSQPAATIATTLAAGAVASDRDDVGNDEYTGFRLSALWKPIESLDITLGYTSQDIEQDGNPDINLDLAGDYQQRRYNTGAAGSTYELLETGIDIVNLVINYDLGWGSLTSSTSSLTYDSAVGLDATHLSGAQPNYWTGDIDIDRLVQELRVTSHLDGSLQFITGLYYEDEDWIAERHTRWSGDPLLNLLGAGNSSFIANDTTLTDQFAIFGELSYAITDQVNATLGIRHFDYERDFNQKLLWQGSPLPDRVTDIDEQGESYKVNLTYTPSDDLLVYGQWAEGFRLGNGGRVNPNCEALNIESGFDIKSDTSETFELGLKSSLADSRVVFNAALYRINWDDIPIRIFPAGNCSIPTNGGKAKSEGIEIELNAQLASSLQANVNLSYGEMTLEETSSIGDEGDNLPGSADVNVSAGLQYDFTMANYESFARIDYVYLSEYFGTPQEDEFGALPAGDFSQINFKIGITVDKITADLFVNNLTNDNGLTWVDPTNSLFGVNRANRIRPRTIGLNVGCEF